MVWCALTMGVAYIVAGVTHFLMPREQLHMAAGIENNFFESLRRTSIAFKIHYWAIMIAALTGAAVVLGIGTALRIEEALFLRILSLGAAFGALVTALSFGLMLKQALRLTDAWQGLSEGAREAVKGVGLPNLDPWGIFGFVLVGIWFLVFNVTAISVGVLPSWLGIVGCLGGASFLLVFVGMLLHIRLLVDVSAALGCIVVSPIWSFSLAYYLLSAI